MRGQRCIMVARIVITSIQKAPAAFVLTSLGLALAACTVGPDYIRPPAPEPARYKELKGWKQATPRDESERGPWWSVFRDPQLDSLARRVEISNQNVASAAAAYRQAIALVKVAQAGLFPVVNARYNPTASHYGARAIGSALGTGITTTLATSSLEGSWQLDLWGRIRRTVESNVAGAQASAADLANATLSAQALLAAAYFNLRAADALRNLLDRTAEAFEKTLAITERQFAAGTVSKADVATARAQLLNTQSQAIEVGIARAQLEHAIAELIGEPPEGVSVPAAPLGYKIPVVPVSVPSALLERRPDIAAAERAMQQQNGLIGANIALYYPDVTLTGLIGFAGTGALALSAANEIWTVGASVAQIAFDGGLRGAQVEAAVAAYDQSVASYRRTVLGAFREVEDQLAAVHISARQQKVADEAVEAAREELGILLEQYRVGTVAFTAVVVAQATYLNNAQSALAVRQKRYLATVALIAALGGGWDAALLPTREALEQVNLLGPGP